MKNERCTVFRTQCLHNREKLYQTTMKRKHIFWDVKQNIEKKRKDGNLAARSSEMCFPVWALTLRAIEDIYLWPVFEQRYTGSKKCVSAYSLVESAEILQKITSKRND